MKTLAGDIRYGLRLLAWAAVLIGLGTALAGADAGSRPSALRFVEQPQRFFGAFGIALKSMPSLSASRTATLWKLGWKWWRAWDGRTV